jgi:DNA replication protein DnaC
MEQLTAITLERVVEMTRQGRNLEREFSMRSFEVDVDDPDNIWDGDNYARALEMERLVNNLRHRGVPERYLAVEWDDLEMVEPLPALRAGCERIDDIIRAGHSLILCGPAGSGKTQAAMLIARAAAQAQHSIAVENVGRLASRIRAAYSDESTTEEQETKRLANAKLLVLDDVGAGESGEAKIERRVLYFVLEERQNNRRPTVITTNLSAENLRAFLGDRLMNRLMPAEVLNFNHGRNFRRPTAATLWAPGGPT